MKWWWASQSIANMGYSTKTMNEKVIAKWSKREFEGDSSISYLFEHAFGCDRMAGNHIFHCKIIISKLIFYCYILQRWDLFNFALPFFFSFSYSQIKVTNGKWINLKKYPHAVYVQTYFGWVSLDEFSMESSQWLNIADRNAQSQPKWNDDPSRMVSQSQ